MAKKKTKSTAICVLGMHRSGTSMITRVVNVLGAYLGEDDEVPWADSYNPAGYWEHQPINAFHERLLAVLRRAWDTALPLPDDWHKAIEIAPFRDELIELIESRFRGKPVWAWKDPRTTILLPVWKDVLAKLNVELRCLLISRNPLDVAHSLKDRNGFPIEEGFGLWLNYNLAMLRNSAGSRRALVSYQRFLANPEASISKWAPTFSLPWPPRDKKKRSEIQRVVRADLCHSASTLRDLSRVGCAKPVIELARLLDAMARTSDLENPDYETKLGRLLQTHSSFSKLYTHDFVRVQSTNSEIESKLADYENRLNDAEPKAAEYAQQLEVLTSQIEEKKDELIFAAARQETFERERSEFRDLLTARDEKIAEVAVQRGALETELQARGNALAEVQELNAARNAELADVAAQRQALESELQARGHALAEAQALNVARDAELAKAVVRREELAKELQAGERALANAQALAAARDAELAQAAERRSSIEARLQSRERELDETRKLVSVREKELVEAGERRELIEQQLRSRESDLADARDLVLTRGKQLAEFAVRQETIEAQLRESEGEVTARREELASLETDLAEAHAHYQRIISTYSWRITGPLRAGLGAVQSAKRTVLAVWHKLVPKKT